MSPDEPVLTIEDRPNKRNLHRVRVASAISMAAAIWFFVSPWVYGAEHIVNAWNCWIIGGVMIGCLWVRLGFPASMPGLSWFVACLGVYIFVSPWLYGYTHNTGRWINSMCVGVVLFVCCIYGGITTKGTLNQSPVARQI